MAERKYDRSDLRLKQHMNDYAENELRAYKDSQAVIEYDEDQPKRAVLILRELIKSFPRTDPRLAACSQVSAIITAMHGVIKDTQATLADQAAAHQEAWKLLEPLTQYALDLGRQPDDKKALIVKNKLPLDIGKNEKSNAG